MASVNAVLFKNSEKVAEMSSKSSFLDAVRELKDKTNSLLTEIISKTSNENPEAPIEDEDGGDEDDEESEESENDSTPSNKKIKLS